jgi:Sec-independent protein translocase protein TatA
VAVIGVAALLLFGPDQLPKVARKAGTIMRDLQSTSQTFIREMEKAADIEHPFSPSAWTGHEPESHDPVVHERVEPRSAPEPFAPEPPPGEPESRATAVDEPPEPGSAPGPKPGGGSSGADFSI